MPGIVVQSPEIDERHGPHPSYVELAKPYIFTPKLRECLTTAGVSEAKDDSIRLQGIAWIDSVRKAMHLPVRTYNTASVYYHKFRLVHPETNGYIDAAAAALFTACKIEDTLKKSKEILCAAYNLKMSPADQVTPDDPLFEQHSKTIIGLERLMLEASGFDFRNRYPQKLLLKIAKHYQVGRQPVGQTAYNMCLDLYRTFAPLKQTAATMAISCVELAGRVWDQNIPDLQTDRFYYDKFHITRAEVMETLLDLLDLYTHHRGATIVGQNHPLEKFISIRITLNQEASANALPRYTHLPQPSATNGSQHLNGTPRDAHHRHTSPTNESPISPTQTVSTDLNASLGNGGGIGTKQSGLKDGTVRFMLDPQRAKVEKDTVAEYLKLEEERYEVEVPVERSGHERDRRRG